MTMEVGEDGIVIIHNVSHSLSQTLSCTVLLETFGIDMAWLFCTLILLQFTGHACGRGGHLHYGTLECGVPPDILT